MGAGGSYGDFFLAFKGEYQFLIMYTDFNWPVGLGYLEPVVGFVESDSKEDESERVDARVVTSTSGFSDDAQALADTTDGLIVLNHDSIEVLDSVFDPE